MISFLPKDILTTALETNALFGKIDNNLIKILPPMWSYDIDNTSTLIHNLKIPWGPVSLGSVSSLFPLMLLEN